MLPNNIKIKNIKNFDPSLETIDKFFLRYSEWCNLNALTESQRIEYLTLVLNPEGLDVFREIRPEGRESIHDIQNTLKNHFNPDFMIPQEKIRLQETKMTDRDTIEEKTFIYSVGALLNCSP